MIVFSVKEHVSQCSAVAYYNRDQQHSGLRYIRLWIHTQYLLVDQFIVGLALLMRFVDYKKIEKITCLSFKLATSLNRLIWQHLIKSFSHVTGCKHSCGFLQTSLLCFSVWQALKVTKSWNSMHYFIISVTSCLSILLYKEKKVLLQTLTHSALCSASQLYANIGSNTHTFFSLWWEYASF